MPLRGTRCNSREKIACVRLRRMSTVKKRKRVLVKALVKAASDEEIIQRAELSRDGRTEVEPRDARSLIFRVLERRVR